MLQFHEEGFRSLLRGVGTLAKAASITLGPKGRHVLIHNGSGSPLATQDGLTIAKEIELRDRFANIGVRLVREAVVKTADVAGDGTKIAILLADALFREGAKSIAAGGDPEAIGRGIQKGVRGMLAALDALAIPVRDIGAFSAHCDPEIGEIVADALQRVGEDGVISVAEAEGMGTHLEILEGVRFDGGYFSPYFVTNPENMTAELRDVSILLVDGPISQAREILPILERFAEEKDSSFLIIAEEMDEETLKTLVVNKIRNVLSVCAVKAPKFGDHRREIVEDIAFSTGGTLLSREWGLPCEKRGDLAFLGYAKRVEVGREKTTLIGGGGDPVDVERRASQLRGEIARPSSGYRRRDLEERLANLVGGVAVIRVGASTEREMREKKARVEDVLYTSRAALAEGVVPGGGVAFIRAASHVDARGEGGEKMGIEVVKRAASAPAIALVDNCGEEGDLIAKKIADAGGGLGVQWRYGYF